MTKVVWISSRVLIGLHQVGPSSFNTVEGSGGKFAEQLWKLFVSILVDAGAPMNLDMYGVSWPADDRVPPQNVHYFCGFEYPTVLEGLTELEFEGGAYLEYVYEGPADDIDSGFQEAYLKALPASGLESREGQHLEIYGCDYDPNSPISKFRILIPVHGSGHRE